MNGFLIDTNVLSEYNKTGGPDAGVRVWLETTARELQHVSVITLAEIQKGSSCCRLVNAVHSSNNGSSKSWRLGFLVGFFL
jgi:predicted nucleic acid-binding protein